MSQQDWRQKEPTEKQVKYAKMLGIQSIPKTSGELSTLINNAKGKTEADVARVKIDLPAKDLQTIYDETKDETMRLIAIHNAIKTVCADVGIDNPAAIGMFFNQLMETRRYKHPMV